MKAFGLILFLAATVFSQDLGTVTGRVFSGTVSNSGVSGSKVTLTSVRDPKIVYSTNADVQGNFRLENVPGGRYRLTGDNGNLSDRAFGEKVINVGNGHNPPFE
jgi:hypothetical protein